VTTVIKKPYKVDTFSQLQQRVCAQKLTIGQLTPQRREPNRKPDCRM